MHSRINCTICENCNRTINSAPGFCVVCGHIFGAVVTAPGTQPELDETEQVVSCAGIGPSMFAAVVWERVAIDTADRNKKRLVKRITA